MDDDEGRASSDDVLTRLFHGTATHEIPIDILEETYAEAQRLCAENGWNEAEGMRIIFANGLSYLMREQDLSRLNQGTANLVDEINRLTKLLNEAQSMYSVMKYQAFVLGRNCQILEMNVTGLRVDHEGMRQRLIRSRSDEDRLRAEVAALRAELAGRNQTEPPAEPAQPASFWERVRNWFKP